MTEISTELLGRLVTGHKRDGRCTYDSQAKSEIVQACVRPGVSVSRIAMQCGVNANLLRRWIVERQLEGAPRQTTLSKKPNASEPSFVALRLEATKPVAIAAAAAPPPHSPPPLAHCTIRLHVRLPNGVEFNLHDTRLEEFAHLARVLSDLPLSHPPLSDTPCSASTNR
jgi:transposase